MAPIDCIRPVDENKAKEIRWVSSRGGYRSTEGRRTVSDDTEKVLSITAGGGVALMVFSRDPEKLSVAGLVETSLVRVKLEALGRDVDLQVKTVEGGRGGNMAVVAIRRRNG